MEIVINADQVKAVTTAGGLVVDKNSWLIKWTPLNGQPTTMTSTLPATGIMASHAIPATYFNAATGLPYQLTLGWSASNGASGENHEIGNLIESSITAEAPTMQVKISPAKFHISSTSNVVLIPSTHTAAAAGTTVSESAPVLVTTILPPGLAPAAAGPINTASPGYVCAVASENVPVAFQVVPVARQVVRCNYAHPLIPQLPSETTLPPLTIPVTIGTHGDTYNKQTWQAIRCYVTSNDAIPSGNMQNIFINGGPLATMTINAPTKSIVARSPQTFSTTGYDAYGNMPTGTVLPVVYTSSISTDTVNGSTITFATPGTRTIRATSGTVTATPKDITVVTGLLAKLKINQIASGHQILAFDTYTFGATEIDQYGNTIGAAPATTRYRSSEPTDTVAGSSITFSKAGPRTITATDNTVSDTLLITVVPPAVASLTISTFYSSHSVDSSDGLYATGYDSAGHSLGDVSATTKFTSDYGTDTITGQFIIFKLRGSHTITARNGSVTATKILNVLAGRPWTRTISPTAAAVVAGGSQPFTSTGVDFVGELLGDVTAITNFRSDDNTDTIVLNSVTFTKAGTHIITAGAGNNGGHYENTASATITVNAAPLDKLAIATAVPVIQVGATVPFTVAGYDHYANPLVVDTTASLTSSEATDTIHGLTVTFTKRGHHVITGTYHHVSGSIDVIVYGPLATLEVYYSSTSATYDEHATAGGTAVLYAYGYDSDHKYLGDVTTGTTFTSSTATDQIKNNSITFTKADERIFTGTNGTATGTVEMWVLPASVAGLSLVSANNTVTVGTPQAFIVNEVDIYGNDIDDMSPYAQLASSNANDEVTGRSILFKTLGLRTIYASLQNSVQPLIKTSTPITAYAGAVASMIIDQRNDMVGGHTQLFTVSGQDRYEDFVDATPNTIFRSSEPTDVIAKNSVTFTKLGIRTITGQDGAVTATVTFHIVSTIPGAVWDWGKNVHGDLGDGTASSRNTPDTIDIGGASPGATIVAGHDSGYATDWEGQHWSWGDNSYGQLGNGSAVDSKTPGVITGPGTGFVSGSASDAYSIDSDGVLWGSGDNSYGQLGGGITTRQQTPVQNHAMYGLRAVTAGLNDVYGLRSDGTVWALGMNRNGQLGNGTKDNSAVPVRVSGLTSVIAIANAGETGYALRSDGTVFSWGLNTQDQLGSRGTVDTTTPAQIIGLAGITAIAAGGNSAYALKSDGTVWDWGSNDAGQLGRTSGIMDQQPAPVDLLTGVTAITAHTQNGYALKADGTVESWGTNVNGELGSGSNQARVGAGLVIRLTNIASITAGDGQVYAIAK